MEGELHPFNKAEDTAQGAKLTYKHIPDLIKPKPPQPQPQPQQSMHPEADVYGGQAPWDFYSQQAQPQPQPQPQQAPFPPVAQGPARPPQQQLDLKAIEHMNAMRSATGLPPLNFSTDKGFTQGAMPQAPQQQPVAQEVPQALSQEVQRIRPPEIDPEETRGEGILRGAREALLPGYGQTAKDTGSAGEGIKEGLANRLAGLSPGISTLFHGLGITEGKGSLLAPDKVTGESSVEERKKRFEQLTALTNEEREAIGLTPELMQQLQKDISSQESKENQFINWEVLHNLIKTISSFQPGNANLDLVGSREQAKAIVEDPWAAVGSLLEQVAEGVLGGAAARTKAAGRLPGVGKHLGPKNVPSAKDLLDKVKEIPSVVKKTRQASKEEAKQRVTKANQKALAGKSWEIEGKRIKAERQARKDSAEAERQARKDSANKRADEIKAQREKELERAKWEQGKDLRNKAYSKRADKVAEKKKVREEEKLNKRKSEVEEELKELDKQIAQKGNSKNWSQYDPEEVAALNKKKISLEGELRDLKAGRQRIPWDKGVRESFLERPARRKTNPTRDFGVQRKGTKITKVVENKSEGQRAADKIKAETKGMTPEQKTQYLVEEKPFSAQKERSSKPKQRE